MSSWIPTVTSLFIVNFKIFGCFSDWKTIEFEPHKPTPLKITCFFLIPCYLYGEGLFALLFFLFFFFWGGGGLKKNALEFAGKLPSTRPRTKKGCANWHKCISLAWIDVRKFALGGYCKLFHHSRSALGNVLVGLSWCCESKSNSTRASRRRRRRRRRRSSSSSSSSSSRSSISSSGGRRGKSCCCCCCCCCPPCSRSSPGVYNHNKNHTNRLITIWND